MNLMRSSLKNPSILGEFFELKLAVFIVKCNRKIKFEMKKDEFEIKKLGN